MRRFRCLIPIALLATAGCTDPAGVSLEPLSPREPLRSHTSHPTTATIAGSLQTEIGCSGDWDPSCAASHLFNDAEDGVWQGSYTIPAGNWEYKAALNDSWTENYGVNASINGANIQLNLGAQTTVKFYYDHDTHWITDNVNAVIATVPGSFQSELGCASDWDPSCLRSWLQDPDGDGTYTFETSALPPGTYEAKVAIDEGWAENYGAGGTANGANIQFNVPASGDLVQFSFNPTTKLLTIAVSTPLPTVTLVGSLQSELGCAGDWDPACAASHLMHDAEDGIWQRSFLIPTGNWEYKAAINDSWTENYGLNASANGANIPLNLGSNTSVKFYYDHATHWITDNRNSVIATVPGSFQSELGCAGDWDPSCLRSWLQDPDGDGIYQFETTAIPAGTYEAKVAIDESWAEHYGAGGIANGANIPFTVVANGDRVQFSYNATTHVLTITVPLPPPTTVGIDILPGSSPNVINSKRLLVTVLLLGRATFDVTAVDATTLSFGPNAAREVHDLSSPTKLAEHLLDLNGDGYVDLSTHFRFEDTGLTKSSTSACLTAASPGGTQYKGCDAVVVK